MSPPTFPWETFLPANRPINIPEALVNWCEGHSVARNNPFVGQTLRAQEWQHCRESHYAPKTAGAGGEPLDKKTGLSPFYRWTLGQTLKESEQTLVSTSFSNWVKTALTFRNQDNIVWIYELRAILPWSCTREALVFFVTSQTPRAEVPSFLENASLQVRKKIHKNKNTFVTLLCEQVLSCTLSVTSHRI